MSRSYDVVVVGGGAAGLLAAGRAASLGRRVILLEKNRKLGVKILMSGGTRCNVTHDCGPREIADAIGSSKGRFLFPALGAFPPDAIVSLLESEEVPTKVEATGKVFPCSDRAVDVRDALVRWARGQGAEMSAGTPVRHVVRLESPATQEPHIISGHAERRAERQKAPGFRVDLEAGDSVFARCVILATGGQSYPGCGTTGDGFVWARSLGHSIVPPVPALTPVTSDDAAIHELAGITLPYVAVEVVRMASPKDPKNDWARGIGIEAQLGGEPNTFASDVGSLLFTHFGFSGPAVMNVSRVVARYEPPNRLRLKLDLLPKIEWKRLDQTLRDDHWKSGGRNVAHAVQAITELPRRVVVDQLNRIAIDPGKPLAELSKEQRREICRQLKSGHYSITGVLGFEKAEVTSGGIDLAEVDRKTMQSRRCPGLFLAGEVLDLDGPIGGYNFQIAFSTGWLAATHAARWLWDTRDTSG